MKAIAIYDSYTGNTEKIAKAIAEELKCKAININNVSKYKIKDYDLVVLGTPVHAWMPSRKIKRFLDKKNINKNYACFCTYGSCYPIGDISVKCCLHYMKKRIDAKCLGMFKCFGFRDLDKAVRFGKFLKDKK